jgi:hypothetical protein
MPGSLLPRDVSDTLDTVAIKKSLLAMLESGKYSVDHYVGDPFADPKSLLSYSVNGYYVRPAVKGAEHRWFDDSWGGACTFHSESGCDLSEDSRPSECRALTPAIDAGCHMPEGWEGKRSVAQAWWPFQAVLKELRELSFERD